MTSSKCSSSFHSVPHPCCHIQTTIALDVNVSGSSVNHHLGYLKEKLKEEEQVRLGLCFVVGSLENMNHFRHGNNWIKIRGFLNHLSLEAEKIPYRTKD